MEWKSNDLNVYKQPVLRSFKTDRMQSYLTVKLAHRLWFWYELVFKYSTLKCIIIRKAMFGASLSRIEWRPPAMQVSCE
jgi:hypothetical protein